MTLEEKQEEVESTIDELHSHEVDGNYPSRSEVIAALRGVAEHANNLAAIVEQERKEMGE